MNNQKISVSLITGSLQITPFSEKILYADNDGDGIPNKDDLYPDEKFDQRFMIVDGLDFKPTCDFQDEHYNKSKESYRSIPSKIFYDTGDKEGIIALLSIIASTTDLPSDLFSALYHSDDISFDDCTGRMEHASEALRHFLDKSGEPINYSASEMYELISSSPYNTTHLQDNLDRAMRCSEQMLKDKSSISFSTKSDAGFKVCCFDNKISDEYPDGTCDLNRGSENIFEKPHTYGKYYNNEHLDWQNTVGEALGGLVCNVSRNGDKYTMNYNYYLLDIYEWAAEDGTLFSKSLHQLHEEGKAKGFLMNGCIEGTYSWIKGEQAFTFGMSPSEDEKATAVLKGLKY